ncbi:hypothetical protein PAXRUDRAFT_577162 [Paxillus rubicundulus Ve08.2h10]|uniref:Uncharacterized protein n=1 Tax=Paxillus rubicundulus Ve08.2h10 TaxID=930991 RepID=A0A0D0E955_9AGAM|nr:hypothetical protein PAXRUDRAFT_577162 [Paxillus rubicundulus Ve08.2h10]
MIYRINLIEGEQFFVQNLCLGMDPEPRTGAFPAWTSRHICRNLGTSKHKHASGHWPEVSSSYLELRESVPNASVVDAEHDEVFGIDSAHISLLCDSESTTFNIVNSYRVELL